jgi:hypothetical protein
MEKKHYHAPLPSRPLCPVCKKPVYSRGGIHPQCAMIQSDPLRPMKKVLLASASSVVSAACAEEAKSPLTGGSPTLT